MHIASSMWAIFITRTILPIIHYVGNIWHVYGMKFRLSQEKEDIIDRVQKMCLAVGQQRPYQTNYWPLSADVNTLRENETINNGQSRDTERGQTEITQPRKN